ncbi:MAG: hypothetical protein WBP54_09730 [Pelodictyon phaeoclathratiforme]
MEQMVGALEHADDSNGDIGGAILELILYRKKRVTFFESGRSL